MPPLSPTGHAIASGGFHELGGGVKGTYDEWAETYEEDSVALGFQSPAICAQTVEQFVVATTDGPLNLLDAGAGNGWLGKLLKDSGYLEKHKVDMQGFDLSEKMLEGGRARGLYSKMWAQDICNSPWDCPSDLFDGVMCNGVLIYVKEPGCLDEFVRVTRKGGLIVLMFRHDGYPLFEAKDLELRETGAWELHHKTEDYDNFPQINTATEAEHEQILFNIWVFRKL
eukprot:NODE_978_length_1189_cov_78.054386_g740_i0.p1 GENE.NODE_978_length_1189_cov_78.054386_g740_i0~~NODE_978_length_1189_cov_78.054386_g740_i0.p1  ORF type:complete len:247 (+),score=78.79 NODE_978_length_1189_cov_78.054386_g740_i0:64-741(+)